LRFEVVIELLSFALIIGKRNSEKIFHRADRDFHLEWRGDGDDGEALLRRD
jgi:hypothetical protein